jgi:hypothetical protein
MFRVGPTMSALSRETTNDFARASDKSCFGQWLDFKPREASYQLDRGIGSLLKRPKYSKIRSRHLAESAA